MMATETGLRYPLEAMQDGGACISSAAVNAKCMFAETTDPATITMAPAALSRASGRPPAIRSRLVACSIGEPSIVTPLFSLQANTELPVVKDVGRAS